MTIPKTDFCNRLSNRTIIEVLGSDRQALLQGIITQDVKRLESEPIIYSLMLSPQGKFQFDFFIINDDDSWLIDIDNERSQEFLQRMQLFKLRSDVAISVSTDWQVGVCSSKIEVTKCFLDPRLRDLGYRFYGKNITFAELDDNYEILRLSLGVPDGSHDMIVDKSIPLEWGMDELNAIAWSKGCYMGQELTARSRYVGQIRKRAFPIIFQVMSEYTIGEKLFADGKEVGELRAIKSNVGIALLKLEALPSEILIKNHPIQVSKPSWMISG